MRSSKSIWIDFVDTHFFNLHVHLEVHSPYNIILIIFYRHRVKCKDQILNLVISTLCNIGSACPFETTSAKKRRANRKKSVNDRMLLNHEMAIKSRRLSTILLNSCCKIMFSWTLSNTLWIDSVDRTCTLSDKSNLATSSESNYNNLYLTLPLLNIITTKWPFDLAARTVAWGDMIFVLASLPLFCVCCTSAVNKEWSAACTNEYLFK